MILLKNSSKIVGSFTSVTTGIKWLNYNRNCKEFAKSYNFEYKTIRIDIKPMVGMTGKIPNTFFESEKNKENNEDEIRNKKLMDDISHDLGL